MNDTVPEGPKAGASKGHPDPEVARTIYLVGQELEVSDKVILASFEAALVESGMENLNYGDRDSLGVFQQRPSQGWGSPEQCLDVNYAARQFFARAREAESDDPGLEPDQIAQAVQRSAHPDRYGQREQDARRLLADAKRALELVPRALSADTAAPPDWAEISEGRFHKTLEYIYSEMIQNQNAPITWVIWFHYKFVDFPLPDTDIAERAEKLFDGAEWTRWLQLLEDAGSHPSALLLFAVKVAPGMDWDHKPKIRRRLGLDANNRDQLYFKIPQDKADRDREVFYDVWSNIHYGYVGRACGIDEDTLHVGPRLPGTGEHDQGDVISMQAGMDLWNDYGGDLTLDQLRDKVYAMIDEIDQHKPNLRQVRVWTAP